MNSKLKKLINIRINDKLHNCSLLVYDNEVWIINEEEKEWVLYYNHRTQLYYNIKKFQEILGLFTLTNTNQIIKEWFENLEIGLVNSILRTNTSYAYMLEKVTKNEKKPSLKERKGFSYRFVKKFLNIETYNGKVLVEDFLPTNHVV